MRIGVEKLLQLSFYTGVRGHPKPANDKTRDIDSDGSPYRLRRHEQCLERRKKTTSHRTGEARMALTAHRASHWCTSRNGRRLPEGGRDRSATPGRLGKASAGKTGQRGDPRPRSIKTGHRGDPRLCRPFFSKTGISP